MSAYDYLQNANNRRSEVSRRGYGAPNQGRQANPNDQAAGSPIRQNPVALGNLL